MSRIKINDLSGDINISRQDMKRVFGGGQDVFAGGMEITPKSSGGKSICAFPDVCGTSSGSGSTIPVPYPNSSGDDGSSGSSSGSSSSGGDS